MVGASCCGEYGTHALLEPTALGLRVTGLDVVSAAVGAAVGCGSAAAGNHHHHHLPPSPPVTVHLLQSLSFAD
eukprot:SAG22_NODE_9862_length_565_cov_1.781116_1_plen_72_part_10